MAEIKRVTLHPLKTDGTIDTNINLYPKTLVTGIVNEEGEAVSFPDDSTLVHNSGNENIGGEKTFTNNVTIATPAGWAGLYFSTDEGKSLAHIEMGEKGIELRSENNFPNSPYYKQYASFNIDPMYGAEFNLYDKGIYFRQRAMQNLCSGYLRFENVNNVDELHLVTYSNDVQTDIVFPAGIDDRVELATKDNCGTKLYEHKLTIQVGSLYYHFRFTSTFSTRITSYELYKSLIVSGPVSITKYAPKSNVFNFYYGGVSDFDKLVVNVGFNYNNDILFSYFNSDGIYKTDGLLHVEGMTDEVTPL